LLQKIPPRKFQTGYAFTASVTHGDLSSLVPLKFRRSQNQSGNDAEIHLLVRIVELRLQNLRVIELFFKRFNRGWACLPPRKTCTARSSAAFGSADESTPSSDATSVRAPRILFPASASE